MANELVLLRADLARVTAERDALRAELDGTNHLAADPSKWGLRALFKGACAQRDALRAEVAALKLDRWAGPWIEVDPNWWMRQGIGKEEVAGAFRDAWRTELTDAALTRCGSLEEARAGADAALRTAGWFLADDTPAKQVNAGSKGA